MLDWPLMEFLDCAWVYQQFKPGTGSNQKSQWRRFHTNGYSEALYGHGGLVPTFVSHQRGWGHEPDALHPLPRRRNPLGAGAAAQGSRATRTRASRCSS